MPTLVFYISGHWFGHASRDIEVINALRAQAPDLRIIVRTAVPRWLFDVTLRAPVDWQPLECDTGVVQPDSLTVDVAETLRQASAFYAGFEERVAREADALHRWNATLVVGDIPPLAFAAGHRAGVPSIALGNFSWDWIYESYEETPTMAPDLVATVRAAYRQARAALRLPLHAGFEAFARVQDVPLIARRSRRSPAEVRDRFGLPRDRVLLLPSFGGYGLRDIDVDALASLRATVALTADLRAKRRDDSPESGPVRGFLPANLRLLPESDLHAGGFRYEDLVAAADVVITKPGYGIIAECAANDTALLYTPRGRFPEYDVLVREMPRYVRCAFISNEDLCAGRWQAAVDGVLRQAAVARPETTGAGRVAELLLAAIVGDRSGMLSP
jgi:L-arabinokinase